MLISILMCGVLSAGCVISAIQFGRLSRRRMGEDVFVGLHRVNCLRAPRMAVITDRACDLIRDAGALTGADIELATRAATLRDIGQSGVSYKLLNSLPFEAWDVADREAFRRHLAITDEILADFASFETERHLLQRSEAMFWLRDGNDKPSPEAMLVKACCDFALNEALMGTERAEALLIQGSGREYEVRTAESLIQVLHSRSDKRVEAIA